MADENIVTNIVANADFSNLIGDVNRVTASLSKLQAQLIATDTKMASQVAAINRSFAENLRRTGQFSTHFVTLSSDAERFGKNLDSGKLKLRDYFRTFQDHTKTSGGLIRDLAKQQVALQNAILQPLGKNAEGLMQFNVHVPRGLDAIKNKSALARQELQIFNKVIQDGGVQLINWGKNTQWAGRQLTVGLTVPLAAFGTAAAKAFREADAELTRLTKVYGDVAGSSAQDLGRVRREVIATSKELSSAMGVNFNETIALAADIAATGKTGNDLLGSIQETTRLAVLGEVDRQEAMKATLAIQTTFKQNTDELSESINFLNAVENQTSTTLSDLVEAIPKAGPVIEGLGGSVKDLALYLTAMREGGVNATEGANALKSSLASLINPTKVAKEMFAGFGIDLSGIVTRNAGNLTGTLLELQQSLDKLDPLQKQQAIEQLFGKFQFSRLNALFSNLGKQGSQTLQVLDLMKASSQELESVATRELGMVTESASGKYKRALESLKADLALVGEEFLKIQTFFINLVDGVLKFVDKLPAPIKSILTFLGGLTAVAGPLIMLTGVLANFFGYIIKGVAHFKALFRGGEGWRMLTPEILAAEKAGSMVEKTFYSDAEAATVLKTAIEGLVAEFTILQQKASSGAISLAPAFSSMNPVTGGRQVNPAHPLLSPTDTRSMSHMNPVAGMTAEQRAAQTLFGVVPGAPKVNQKISNNPQIYMQGDLPNVPGLTRVNGVSTGVVAEEAAKWHAMTGALAMQSEREIGMLKKEVATTGLITTELSESYQALLPKMTQITSNAATASAAIVAELQASKITVDQARAKIMALNAEVEAMMGSAATQVATSQGRNINLGQVPLLNQPVVDASGKSNMKELMRPGRTRGLLSKIAGALKVKTFGAPYSMETTVPRRFALGGVNIQKFAGGYINPMAALKAAKMLRAFSKKSSMIGGLRTPRRSTIGGAEKGVGTTFGQIYKRDSKIYSDPEYQAYGITPTSGDDYLIHGMTPAFRQRTANLKSQGSAPFATRDDWSYFNLQTTSKQAGLQLLPTQFIKNDKLFNNGLRSNLGADPSTFRPVVAEDMVSLLLFLKEQGLRPQQAKAIAGRAAEVLNYKIQSHKGPITEDGFGRLLNNASVRAIQSGAKPSMVGVRDTFGHDAHSRNRGSQAIQLKEKSPFGVPGFAGGVTKLGGYGGGDTIPALLEPGESVITKTATRGNEGTLSLLNSGVPVDKVLGFQSGVVSLGVSAGLGIGGQMAGARIGQAVAGNTGSAIGGIAGSMLGMIPYMSSFTKSADGAAAASGRFGKALRWVSMLPPQAKIAAVAIAAIGAAFYKVYDVAKKARQASADSLDVNKMQADQLGITYVSMADKVKRATDAAIKSKQLLAAKAATAGQVGGGLSMTIKELNEMKKVAKETQPELVKMFDNMNRDDVVANATALKVQMVAAGKSAADAAKSIFSIISVSNKADMAIKAISSAEFQNIIDKTTAAKQAISSFAAAAKTGANTDKIEIAAAFESGVEAIDSYYKSLEKVKNANGELVTDNKAVAKTIEEMSKSAEGQQVIGQNQLAIILQQKPEYRNILNSSDSIVDAWAKIKLYTEGVQADLKNISGQDAQKLLQIMESIKNAAVDMTTVDVSSKNPLAELAKFGIAAKKASDLAKAASDRAAAAAKSNGEKETKALDAKIKKINEEYDARIKALNAQKDQESYSRSLQSVQLEYQAAVASGDMNAAAQAQIKAEGLVAEFEQQKALQKLQDERESKLLKLEKEKEQVANKVAAAQKAAAAAAEKAAKAAEKLAKIQLLQQSIASTLAQASSTEDPNKLEQLSKALQSDVNTLKSMGSEGESAAAGMKADITSRPGVKGTRVYSEDWVGKLKELSTATMDVATKKAYADFKMGAQDFKLYASKLLGLKAPGTVKVTTVGGSGTGGSGSATFAMVSGLTAAGEKSTIGSKFTDENGVEYKITNVVGGRAYVTPTKPVSNTPPTPTPQTRNRAMGGFISGPGSGTSDSIPAMLSNGEFVFSAKAVKNMGINNIESLHEMLKRGPIASRNMGGIMMDPKYTIPKMSTGGRVNMAQAGLARSISNDTITINNSIVAAPGMNIDQLADAIAKKTAQGIAMAGRPKQVGG
jgi:TP901 family phage tail tape measure protein